jgi:hypothetical protein
LLLLLLLSSSAAAAAFVLTEGPGVVEVHETNSAVVLLLGYMINITTFL